MLRCATAFQAPIKTPRYLEVPMNYVIQRLRQAPTYESSSWFCCSIFAWHFLSCHIHMSYNLNSFNGGYIRDSIREYYRGY